MFQKPKVRFTIFAEQRDRVLFSQEGPLSQFTKRAAQRAKEASANHVGTTYSGDHGGRRLRNSGTVEPSPIGGGRWNVVFRHRAAVVHYTGAKPHMMRLGAVHYRKSGMAPFGPRKSPFSGDGRRVDHPGHAANRYLEKGARDIGLVISQRPTGFSRSGFARIPRGFA